MRLLALGRNTLREICDAHSLNYSSWVAITNTTLFKAELEKVVREIEEREIETASTDPVRLKLMAAGEKAATRLVAEMDNMSADASASTRIKAAESILDRLGYSQRQEESRPQQTIVLNVSASKLQLLQNIVLGQNLKPLAEATRASGDTAGEEVQPGASQPAVPVLVEA